MVLQLKQCSIEKKEGQLILSILSKLDSEYLVLVSTFHATKLVVRNWRIPSLDAFIDSLTQEQDKLVQMGILIYLKYHVLSSHGDVNLINAKSKGKQRIKEKRNSDEERSGSTDDDSKSKRMKSKRDKPPSVVITKVIIMRNIVSEKYGHHDQVT